jgi:hypothetical protein
VTTVAITSAATEGDTTTTTATQRETATATERKAAGDDRRAGVSLTVTRAKGRQNKAIFQPFKAKAGDTCATTDRRLGQVAAVAKKAA